MTDAALKILAEQIRDETNPNANTAFRIGTLLVNLVNNKINIIYGVNASGTDNYVATVSESVVAYVSGQQFKVKFGNTNTGPVTIKFNALAYKPIVKNVDTPLEAGDIPAGRILDLVYDGTNFQIIGGLDSGLTDWDMSTDEFPSGSKRGRRYYGINGPSYTLVDRQGEPIPDGVIITSLEDDADTEDPTKWAIQYTII